VITQTWTSTQRGNAGRDALGSLRDSSLKRSGRRATKSDTIPESTATIRNSWSERSPRPRSADSPHGIERRRVDSSDETATLPVKPHIRFRRIQRRGEW
jgi:hypothetical protein